MPPKTTRRSSTLRFALGVISAIVLVVVLVLWLVISDLRADIAARRERLHRAGVPMTKEELAPRPIPDDRNAAVVYARAAKAASFQPTDWDTLDGFLSASQYGRTRYGTQVAAIVARNHAALDLLVAGARRPDCQFPLDWSMPNPFYRPTPTPEEIHRLAAALLARAVFRIEAKEFGAAIDDCQAAIALSAHVFPCMPFVFYSTRESMSEILRDLVEAHALDAPTCRDLFNQLQRPDLNASFRRSSFATHTFVMWCFDSAEHNPRKFCHDLRSALSVDMRPKLLKQQIYFGRIGSIVRLSEEAHYLERFERGLALYRRPYRETARLLAGLERETARTPRYGMDTITYVLDGMMVLGRRGLAYRDGFLARQRGIQIALALAAYRSKYGGYPASLDELKAYPGWPFPDDPFTGRPFVYRPNGTGFIVYSFGADLDDDHGNPGDYARLVDYLGPEPKGDIALQCRR